jgi:hypothetical protein
LANHKGELQMTAMSVRNTPMEGSEENCPFGPDWRTNMATTENSCFWLAGFFFIFSSERTTPNELLLCRWPYFFSNLDQMGNFLQNLP